MVEMELVDKVSTPFTTAKPRQSMGWDMEALKDSTGHTKTMKTPGLFSARRLSGVMFGRSAWQSGGMFGRSAQLSGGMFRRSQLCGVMFGRSAQLFGVMFRRSQLSGVMFGRSQLSGVMCGRSAWLIRSISMTFINIWKPHYCPLCSLMTVILLTITL